MADKEIIVDTDGVDIEECESYLDAYFGSRRRAEQKLKKIKEYLSTYIETEDHIKTDILKIIEGEENE